MPQADKPKCGLKKGLEILSHLARYGLVSNRTLRLRIGGSVKQNQVHRSLAVLCKKGLVSKLNPSFEGQGARYYRLTQSPAALGTVGRLINADPKALDQPGLRFSHYAHEDLCARLHITIEQLAGSVEVIRDFAIQRSNVPEYVLPQNLIDEKIIPDLILRVRSNSPTVPDKYVAVELERTRKRDDRVESRFSKYASATGFHALLYIVPSDILLRSYISNFSQSIAPNVWRIAQAKNSFFSCSVLPEKRDSFAGMKIVVDGEQVGLVGWMNAVGLLNRVLTK